MPKKKTQVQSSFYSLESILKKKAVYNVIFGERSNGKTYAVLEYALREFWKSGKQLAYIRRWREDFTGKRGSALFEGLVANGLVSEITGGEWTGIYYYSSRWYLSKTDENGARVLSAEPLAFGFSLSSTEHDKGTQFPNVGIICFDEFLARTGYIPDEFVLLMNTISTIIRHRIGIRVFMLGNTVNKYCPYFTEMGLKHVGQMKPGSIDLYTYGKSELTVAVEYCKPNEQGKPSDVYFAFDNPKLQMITGGAWELDIYPHAPCKWRPKDVIFNYFISFDGQMLQADIVCMPDRSFTFIHRKTSDLKEEDRDIVFTPDFDSRPNWRRRINAPFDTLGKKIAAYYASDKVFYQDNEVGDTVKNYLMWCGKAGGRIV